MRFTGVTRKEITPGSENYIGQARTLLGIVQARIDDSGGLLSQYQMRHMYKDGTVIEASVINNERKIRIWKELEIKEEEENKGVPALFRFIPGKDRPQAIIKLKKKESESDPDEFELYFDERIKGSGVYTQSKRSSGLLYSLNENQNEKGSCKIPALTLPIFADYAIPDSFFYYKPVCYYPKITLGHATKNVYAGGYLLYIAEDNVIGIGEIEGQLCLATRKDNIVSFWEHKVLEIDFSRTTFNTPIIKTGAFTLVKEITLAGNNNEPCGLCTFSDTGEEAQFTVLETIVEATNKGLVTRGYFIQHLYNISISLNALNEIQISDSKTQKTIKTLVDPDGVAVSYTPHGDKTYQRVGSSIRSFSISLTWTEPDDASFDDNHYICGVDDEADDVWQRTEDWHYSNVPSPGVINYETWEPSECFNTGHGSAHFVYNLSSYPVAPYKTSHSHSLSRDCRVLTEETSYRTTATPGTNTLDKTQTGILDAYTSIDAEGNSLIGSFFSGFTSAESGKFRDENPYKRYYLNYVYVDAAQSLMEKMADFWNDELDTGSTVGQYDYSRDSDTVITFSWKTLTSEITQVIDTDYPEYSYETADPPPDSSRWVAFPYADSYWNDYCPSFVWHVAVESVGAGPRHKLTYSGSNDYSKTSIDLYSVSLRNEVALIYTYKENHAATLAFDEETDTNLTWSPSVDEFKNTGTKKIELETAVGARLIPGLTSQIGTAEVPAGPNGTIMDNVTPPDSTTNYNALTSYDVSRKFPMCCHPDGYVLLSANDYPMLANADRITGAFNLALFLYNINDDTFTDVKELYNEALLENAEELEAQNESYNLQPLLDTAIYDVGILNHMEYGWGVLGTVPE